MNINKNILLPRFIFVLPQEKPTLIEIIKQNRVYQSN